MMQSPSWDADSRSARLVRNPKFQLPCPQKSTTVLCPEPDESIVHPTNLSRKIHFNIIHTDFNYRFNWNTT